MTVPDEILTRLREVCLALPEAYEEEAWLGTRWRIRKKTFAHVLYVEGGRPPWFADVIDGDGLVLTFRASPEELHALTNAGHPFYKTVWPDDMIAMMLGDHIDWDEITELMTDSYRVMAPKSLAKRLT
ncbi:MmcQ/YjbR family DNA-binding protein [Kibdelosporangium aridum]|uniref:MmcQ/YjbR family DNA-binding protein n=1 Tax=Kibdelosporangium aridum TaxID=2030 RepID=A0A428ZMW7_KIBAR|nr:MmcQ/YjbR family DNA-binding protein [Kibdelosporangium aridum]RSM89390.1 MmcQ/YjbR family DNA-binding protein [Kibdelosporangium aridum]